MIKILSIDLKEFSDVADLIESGSWFQRVGAAEANDRSPHEFEVRGMVKRHLLAERSSRRGLYGTSKFEIYEGEESIVERNT